MHLSDQLVVASFIALLGIAIGGGLYEILAVYPGWSHDPAPATLKDKLRASGQSLRLHESSGHLSPRPCYSYRSGILFSLCMLPENLSCCGQRPALQSLSRALLHTPILYPR